jgi:hypothetical protein
VTLITHAGSNLPRTLGGVLPGLLRRFAPGHDEKRQNYFAEQGARWCGVNDYFSLMAWLRFYLE